MREMWEEAGKKVGESEAYLKGAGEPGEGISDGKLEDGQGVEEKMAELKV